MSKQNRQLVEEYEINPFTLMVMPIAYGSKVYSKIYELEEEYLSPFKPLDIVKKSCEFFGSTYEGRKEGTRKLIGVTHKVPIAIAPTNFIYFFPTTSPEKPQCVWISHENITDYQRGNGNGTLVTFKNRQTLEIPISYNSFQNQIFRTVMLKSKLLQRIEETNKKATYLVNMRFMEASEMKTKYGKLQ